MARIVDLVISDEVLEKLAVKHGISFSEVEEACLYRGERDQVQRVGRGGVMLLYGRSFAGRYLTVVLAHKKAGAWRVVTARDMTDHERRNYRRNTGA
jgi:uncharacterized DUF497 family protein